MSKHDPLINVARHLGYNDHQVSKILGALGDDAPGAVIRAVADRRGMVELPTPMQCAARSEQHAANLRQVDGEIFHASGCTYRLPANQSVNVYEVDKAIKGAPLNTRIRIKGALHALGLIPA